MGRSNSSISRKGGRIPCSWVGTRDIIERVDVPASTVQFGGPNKGYILNHLDGNTGIDTLVNSGEYGVRGHAPVESAVATPRATSGGELLHRIILAVFNCRG